MPRDIHLYGWPLCGGDPCPVCGVELGYEEIGDPDDCDVEPVLVHPDPQCGWPDPPEPAAS